MIIKNWLSTNTKLRRSGIYSWGIPAYKSASGFTTCPGAQACIVGCYAKAGMYVMPSVKKSQEQRLELSQGDQRAFVKTISDEIKRRKIKTLRIHDAGDFYSLKYLQAWIEIMQACPETHFYAYTKMVPLFHGRYGGISLPPNFRVIFSYGGKFDAQIHPDHDRHSAIFPDKASLQAMGYADAHEFDHVAAFGENHRIGLIYHGPASRSFTAGQA